MKRIIPVLIIVFVFTLLCGFSNYELISKTPANPQDVVKQMYENINAKNFNRNLNLFMYPGAEIIAYGKGRGINNTNKRSASNWIDWQYSEKQWNHYVDNIDVNYISNTLCTVLVKGHTGSWRVDFSSIFILSKENNEWKIVSMTQENK